MVHSNAKHQTMTMILCVLLCVLLLAWFDVLREWVVPLGSQLKLWSIQTKS